MSDNEENKVDVKTLGYAQLADLTIEQMQAVAVISLRKNNRRVYKPMMDVLDTQEERTKVLADSMKPPFAYTSPEIEVITGVKVKFRTLLDGQTEDIYRQQGEFESADGGGNSPLRSRNMLKLYLVHNIHKFNGADPGGVVISADLFKLAEKDQREQLKEIREKRMQWLRTLGTPLVDLLCSANEVFSKFTDSIVNITDDPAGREKVISQLEAVGK